jgi:hypothetical protein
MGHLRCIIFLDGGFEGIYSVVAFSLLEILNLLELFFYRGRGTALRQ